MNFEHLLNVLLNSEARIARLKRSLKRHKNRAKHFARLSLRYQADIARLVHTNESLHSRLAALKTRTGDPFNG